LNAGKLDTGARRIPIHEGSNMKTPSSENSEDRGSHIKAPAKPTTAYPISGGSGESNQPKKP
jgi:hypothetical protein